jgi:hypothetical protein
MFRKLALVLGATVVIASAALIPTSASAHMHGHGGHGWGHGWGYGIGIYAPTAYVASDCYYVKQLVNTPVGPRVRRVAVCD